jgi:uncharacterized protein YeeX (DUF496 family)
MKSAVRVCMMSFLAFTILATAGCEEPAFMDLVAYKPESPAYLALQRERNPYLAYEHRVSIEVDEQRLQPSFEHTLRTCSEDAAHACEIHHSSLSTGDYPSAEIRVRIKRDGVAGFIQAAAENNRITRQSVSAEDLAAPIRDNEKRLKMLEDYQRRLVDLESRAAKDVDSLIKIASEVAKTQSDLEAVKGEQEFLMKRVRLDMVSIHFHTDDADSFLGPVGKAFDDFGHNLARGIAGTVTAAAYILPWSLILIGLFFLLRWLWSRRKRG